MELIRVSQSNKSEYQSFVSANGNFLQDYEWGEFQASQGRKVYRFLLKGESEGGAGGEIKMAAQILSSRFSGKTYLFAPCGPVAEGNSPESGGSSEGGAAGMFSAPFAAEVGLKFKEYLEEFASGLSKQFPDAVFLRIEPRLSSEDFAGGGLDKAAKKTISLDPHKTLILDLRPGADSILAEMKQKTRYNIKVAQKHGVIVRTDIIKNVWKPFDETSKRAKIRSYGPKYYESLAEFFESEKGNIQVKVYTAWHGKDLLATNLMVWRRNSGKGGTATYLFGGSSAEKRQMMAPYLLHWQAIQDAASQGFDFYDFWGVEDDPNHSWAGISKFKTGFGGKIIAYAGTYDYVFNSSWYNVYTVLRKLNRAIRK